MILEIYDSDMCILDFSGAYVYDVNVIELSCMNFFFTLFLTFMSS
jgi:hypothetical protein